jgi:hypothetical protein
LKGSAVEQQDIEKLVADLEIAVDRLRSLYEQYFMGIEKIEPAVARKDVDRRIYVLRKEQIRNTALRFRFQMILQRYNTYQSHWQRVCREIENGTYKRHLARAQKRFASAPPPEPPTLPFVKVVSPGQGLLPPPSILLPHELAAELAELDREFAPASPSTNPSKQPPRPPRPAAFAPRSPGPVESTVSEGLSDDRVRQLYAQYVSAKRRQNESTAAITFEAVAKSLRESSAKLRQKHGKPVDFEVAVKDGKAILKPFLKS